MTILKNLGKQPKTFGHWINGGNWAIIDEMNEYFWVMTNFFPNNNQKNLITYFDDRIFLITRFGN
jgi:hypothetical protein